MRRFLFVAMLTACTLGGTGKPPGGGDDTTTVDNAKCTMAMAAAPLAPAGFDAHDSLATATHNTWDAVTMPQPGDAAYPGGKYRTITTDATGHGHPGCSTTGLVYPPATITGFPCAARQFEFPSGVTEDTTKPIVILVHGNSDGPNGWIKFLHPNPASLMFPADTTARDQLAEILPAQGFRTIAIDMRTDLVDDPMSPEGKDIGNTPKNQDHGWQVPMLQELVKQIAIANPDRKLALVGHSLGVTVVRDALRRLWVEWSDKQWDVNIFERVTTVVLASGANHGVVSFQSECGLNLTMRGTVTCEMGQRNQYNETDFARPLNGPAMTTDNGQFGGWWETPCADGDYAYGKRGACGGHTVTYTTITMKDLPNGTQQDEFVSEAASRLYPTDCANNVLDELTDFDTSGYFYNGFFRNHYGSVRSDAGLAHVVAALGGN
jgi:pimeloyl-ACP methyl ester carboxylesterase